ncbi:hypothetical protein IEQ_05120 [Bacillus cereus BAG6X1-2]|nr:hypothetical protein IEQ_05120 [Bacillus cereus BAG6X1-2]
MITLNNYHYGFVNSNAMYEDLTFRFNKGEVINILGENGAGKSAFFKALLNKIPYSGGEYHCAADTISVISDYVSIPKELKLKDLLNIVSTNEQQEWLQKMIADLKLSFEQRIGQLSTGQKRLIEISCAVSKHNGVLICDEMTNGLDIKNRKIVLDFLKNIMLQKQHVLFYTSHNFEDHAYLGGRFIFLDRDKKRFIEKQVSDLEDINHYFYEICKKGLV